VYDAWNALFFKLIFISFSSQGILSHDAKFEKETRQAMFTKPFPIEKNDVNGNKGRVFVFDLLGRVLDRLPLYDDTGAITGF
jgi:hypothetical protein